MFGNWLSAYFYRNLKRQAGGREEKRGEEEMKGPHTKKRVSILKILKIRNLCETLFFIHARG